MKKAYFILLFCFITHHLFTQCNGLTSLCNKKYNESVFVTTHNAFNYDGPFSLPNQFFPISQQLQDGVRGLMIDVYDVNGIPTVYHGYSFLGTQPLSLILNDIKSFLDNNPNEVISIIFESYISGTMMETAFSEAQLLPYLHTQPLNQNWPTLQEMINDNKRLVVFTDDTDNATASWYHDIWDYAVETEFSISNRTEFTCKFNRGDSLNDLFILNHFITNPNFGTGLPDSAVLINESGYLMNRTIDCYQSKGKIPNFLTVDFYDKGNPFEVANAWNSSNTTDLSNTEKKNEMIFSPNPCDSYVSIHFTEKKRETTLEISDIAGKILYREPLFPDTPQFQIETQKWPSGVYFIRDTYSNQVFRLMVKH